MTTLSPGAVSLLEKFGPLMLATDVAEILCFPSKAALLAAIRRGSVDLKPVVSPGRKRTLFSKRDVQLHLDALLASNAADKGD